MKTTATGTTYSEVLILDDDTSGTERTPRGVSAVGT
jgi:hypothetical protein